MMRTWLSMIVVGLQLLTLTWMAFERELVLRTGRVVYLRTAPIDPRDAFRGDYVRLDYEINHVPKNRLRDGLVNLERGSPANRDRRVYGVLHLEGDLAQLDYVTDRKPGEGLFLRGRIKYCYGVHLNVRWGIEKFFVQEGKGLEIERGRRDGDVQIPLEMQVAIGRTGMAVPRSYRWCKLGMGLRIDTEPQVIRTGSMERTNLVARAATVILQNTSSNDIAIVDLPGSRSLTLEADTLRFSRGNKFVWVSAGEPRPAVTDKHVKVLKPGEQHTIRVDLRQPEWYVSESGKEPISISEIRNRMFRLIYRPPSAAECEHLRQADLIWHGYLMSRAFNGGRVD